MADIAHTKTDQKLEQMERHLSAIYSKAQKETGKAWKKYLDESGKEIADLQKAYDDAKKSGDDALIKKTGYQLGRAKKERTLQDKRFKDLTAQLAADVSHVNETALAYVNGELPGVYALNYNALEDTVSGDLGGYSFTLTDANTVKSLAESDKNLLPYKEIDGRLDVRWNVKKINAEVLQGILQGESMDKIAGRFSKVMEMNRVSAIRNARTTVTGAENKGRQDSYEKATSDGIQLEREWISTNDGRTRHSHRLLDGQTAPVDKPFQSELGPIRFPGDPEAAPANVYNCRCTMAAKVIGFKKTVEKTEPVSSYAIKNVKDGIKEAEMLGVKYARFEKMDISHVQNIVDAVKTLPKDCVPKFISNGKDVSTVTGRKLGRKADQWWGVTYDYRPFGFQTMQLGYDKTDYDGGLIVGINTQKFKTPDMIKKSKEENEKRYFERTSHHWNFNTDGRATAFHEIGHCYVDVRGLPDGWDKISKKWCEESKCDLLNSPEEAFAEAWAAYHTGNENLPKYVSDVIKGLK